MATALMELGASSINFGRRSAISVYALIVYDWLISLNDEVDLVWMTPQWTVIKSLYVFCRYYPLLVFPIYLWLWLGDHEDQLCHQVTHPLYAFLPIFQFSSQAVMFMRMYAFTGRNKYVLAVLGSCFLGFAGAEIWLYGFRFVVTEQVFREFGKTGCFAIDWQVEHGKSPRAVSAGLITLGVFFFDLAMLLAIGVYYMRERSIRGSLASFFVLQGTMVFISMSILNLFTSITYLSTIRNWNGVSIPYSSGLGNILACRLILNLRRRMSPTESYQLQELSRLVREGIHETDTDVG